MLLSRENHYVPKMYLSGWAQRRNIYFYDLLVANENTPMWSKPKQVSQIAYMENLYIGVLSGEEFDDLEHEIDKRFETPAKKPLEKIRCEQRLTSEEWRIITDFIAAQYVRVPAFYHNTHDLMITCAKDVLNHLPPINEKGEEIQKTKNNPKNTTAKEFIPLSIELTNEKAQNGDTMIKIGTTVGKGYWFHTINSLFSEHSMIKTHFRRIKWSICKSTSGLSWPICDNPVVILNARSNNPGLSERDNVFIFPISPTLVLVGKNVNRLPWKLLLTTEQSMVIRDSIILNAQRYIYNSSPDEEIIKIRPRTVNMKEYRRIQKMYDEWHDNYKEKEGPLLNTDQKIIKKPE